MKSVLIGGILSIAAGVAAFDAVPGEREMKLETATLSAVVRDGRICDLRDRVSGKVWADRSAGYQPVPAGLGIVYDLPELRRGHIPWGEPALKQELPAKFPLVNYFLPDDRSRCSFRKEDGKAVAVWKGLTNGKVFLPDAELAMTFAEAADGALEIVISGENPGGGVFGATCAVGGLGKKAQFVVPAFGGLIYRDGTPGILSFGRAPFLEAPLLILNAPDGSLGLWTEDGSMRPIHAFAGRGAGSFSLALENNTLMPFEDKRSVRSVPFRLNLFRGDWREAAAPYRNWFRSRFAPEIAVRDALGWAKQVTAVADLSAAMPDDAQLGRMAAYFPPGSMMLHTWNARAPHWDCDLPDWTPRAGYADGVKRAKAHGFRTMGYVNTYCANFRSAQWTRDGLDEFFLTRKNSLWQYKGKSVADLSAPMHELLLGTVDYVDGADQFKGIPAGRLLYGDPLSKRWRAYHAAEMKRWREATGTDANYEDTAGTVGDHGNGVVDGLSAGEGSIEQMRILQQTQQEVALSSEFGPAAIAFAIHWSLNYPSVWGNDGFKRYLIHHHLPLTAYLYGYRHWVPSARGFNDMIRHAMAATADASGGMGVVSAEYYRTHSDREIGLDRSFEGHFHDRARLFAEKRLTPDFAAVSARPDAVCAYRGTDGLYWYCDDGALQQMIAPGGEPLYGRVDGVNRVKSSLALENWPFQSGGVISGLNPEEHYPLFRSAAGVQESALRGGELPEGGFVRRSFDTPEFAELLLDRLPDGPERIKLHLQAAEPFAAVTANGKPVALDDFTAELPLRLIALRAAAGQGVGKVWIARLAAGRMLGSSEPLRPGNDGMAPLPGEGGLAAWRVAVPQNSGVLELRFRNRADLKAYPHDGGVFTLRIDGAEVRRFDTRTPNPEWKKGNGKPEYLYQTETQQWSIPLDAYRGRTILATLEFDCRDNASGDRPEMALPRLADGK